MSQEPYVRSTEPTNEQITNLPVVWSYVPTSQPQKPFAIAFSVVMVIWVVGFLAIAGGFVALIWYITS